MLRVPPCSRAGLSFGGMNIRRIGWVVLIGVIFGALKMRAEDWPQWRGPTRDGYVPAGVAVPASLPSTPKVVWRIALGNGLSSPVVCGGKVFYLDNQKEKEVVHAANAATGEVLWSTELDDVHKDSQSTPGPRCTPTADGDRIYAQSGRGQLRCLNAADGKEIWATNYVKDFGAIFIGEKGKADGASRHGYTGSPIVDGENLIAEVGGQHGASVVCFEKKAGKVVWQSESKMPGYAAPIVTTAAGVKQVICFMADGVMGLDRTTGKLLWQAPVKTSLARHVTTPVVIDDIVMVASHQVGLVGVKLTRSGEGVNAETIWTAKDSAINFSSPVAVGKYLYGLGPNKNLICVDPHTGKQMWSKDEFLTGNAGKSEVGMIVMGENMLILTDDGNLALVAADPKAFHEIARTRACGNNWCNPAYVGGRLFVRDAKELLCLQILE